MLSKRDKPSSSMINMLPSVSAWQPRLLATNIQISVEQMSNGGGSMIGVAVLLIAWKWHITEVG
jgi:hypothetical protein